MMPNLYVIYLKDVQFHVLDKQLLILYIFSYVTTRRFIHTHVYINRWIFLIYFFA